MEFILFPLFILVFLGWSSFFIVKQKQEVLIETLGRYTGTRKAGLNFKLPAPISVVAGTLNMKTQGLPVTVGVKTLDNAFLEVPVTLQYKVFDAEKAFYELNNPEAQMEKFVTNNIRSVASGMTMDELFKSSARFGDAIREKLNEKFAPFGFIIEEALVDDPQPSDKLKEAFDLVLTAERKKDAAKNEAEALKIKMIGEAEAEKSSLELKGEAFVAYRDKIAEGNTEAMEKMLKGTDNLTSKDILNFFAAIDRNEANRDMAGKSHSTIIVTGDSSATGDNIALIKALSENS